MAEGHRIPIEAALDLHAFAPRDVRSVVEEYVLAAHEAGLGEVRLIHGRGTGIQRGIVQSVLEKHPLVRSFYDAPESHLGATVVELEQEPEREPRTQNSELRTQNSDLRPQKIPGTTRQRTRVR